MLKHQRISTLLDRIVHVCITTAHAQRSGRSAKLEINKPSTSKLVRSLDKKLTVCLSPILHSALIFAHAQFYLRGCLFRQSFFITLLPKCQKHKVVVPKIAVNWIVDTTS